MLTRVILEGQMGKEFGREWELEVSSPSEALRLIDANRPGVFQWIRSNLETYSHYRVVCEYENGEMEELDEEGYVLERRLVSIRFVPLVQGAGGGLRVITGVAIIAVALWVPLGLSAALKMAAVSFGASLALGGITSMLTPKTSKQETSERKDNTSYYFDGPANTTMQGVPVQLIYGRVLVGSHGISAALTIDQLM